MGDNCPFSLNLPFSLNYRKLLHIVANFSLNNAKLNVDAIFSLNDAKPLNVVANEGHFRFVQTNKNLDK